MSEETTIWMHSTKETRPLTGNTMKSRIWTWLDCHLLLSFFAFHFSPYAMWFRSLMSLPLSLLFTAIKIWEIVSFKAKHKHLKITPFKNKHVSGTKSQSKIKNNFSFALLKKLRIGMFEAGFLSTRCKHLPQFTCWLNHQCCNDLFSILIRWHTEKHH